MDITREKEATLALKHSSKLYKQMNSYVNQMLNLKSLEGIYSFITQTLREQYPDTAVIFATVNQEQTKAKMIQKIGIPESKVSSMLEVTGFNLFDKEYNVSPEHYPMYTSGELVTFENGFADFVGSEISYLIAKAVEKLIDIPKIYSIGINNDGKLFGIVYFFSKNKNFTADHVYLQSFMSQAGIVINRKLMEESLRNSEEIFRNLVENQGEGVGMTDQNEVFTFANPAAHQIFGVKQGELINASLKSFLSEEAQLKIMHETNLRKQGQKSMYEIEIIQPGGKVVPLLVTVTPQFDKDHNFTGSFGVFRDITENKRAEMLIRKSEEHYRMLSTSASEMLMLNQVDDIYKYVTETLQRHLSDTVVIFNMVDEERLKTKLLHIKGISNRLLKKIFQLTDENIIGKEYNLLPGHHKIFKQGRLIQFEGGLPEFTATEMPTFITKSIKKMVGVEQIYSIGINQGNRLYAAVHLFTMKKNVEINHKFIDSFIKQAGIIIERKILEQSLKTSEEKFSSFLNKSSDAILLTDEDYNLIYLNKAFENLTGYDMAEMLKTDVFELNYRLYPDGAKKNKSFKQYKEDFMKQINSLEHETQGKIVDTELQSKHGKLVSIQARFFTIRTLKGRRLGAISRDVTEQKEKEKSLQELNATKDRLFSIIGHDLKNPLNSIVGFTQLMNQNFDTYSDEKLRKYVGIINQSATSLSALLDNLLLWSQAQRKKISIDPGEISFREITEKCFSLLQPEANKKNIHLINKLTNVHVGYADDQMMTTVVRNLLANAIKFTPQGGRIVVDGKCFSDKLILSIKDSGIGIEKEVAKKLFQPNIEYSTVGTDGEKGTGLGLIICKEFVEKNNGSIWVESDVGKGSTFFISVPVLSEMS
jgi:PAS domain S-box-containing protein